MYISNSAGNTFNFTSMSWEGEGCQDDSCVLPLSFNSARQREILVTLTPQGDPGPILQIAVAEHLQPSHDYRNDKLDGHSIKAYKTYYGHMFTRNCGNSSKRT